MNAKHPSPRPFTTGDPRPHAPAALVALLLLAHPAAARAQKPAGGAPPAGTNAPDPAAPRTTAPDPSAAGAPAAEPLSAEDLVRQGNELRRAGQMRAAVGAFRTARSLAPRSYEIRVLLADTLRRIGEVERALPEYDAARSLDPARPEGYSGRGLILRARYDYEGAVAILEEGLKRVAQAARPDLLLVMAETRRRQGRLEEARRLFEEEMAARDRDAPARAGLAQVAEDRGDLDGAVKGWDDYLAIKADDDAAATRRQELRELRASIEALRGTAAREPGGAILAELGRLLAIAGDRRGAVQAYRDSLRAEPRGLQARRGLALALRDAGPEGAQEAAREFRAVLRSSPGDGVALYNLVAIARASGDPAAEGKAWRDLALSRPDDPFAQHGYQAFLEAQGPEVLARALRVLPESPVDRIDPGLLRLRALLLTSAGRREETAATLSALLIRDPTDPWSLEVANEILFLDPGLLQSIAGRLAPAPPVPGTVAPGGAGTAPDSAAADATLRAPEAERRILLARLTWWSGRGEEALVVLRQAVAAFPDSAIARSALGEGYQEIAHRPDLAIAELRKALEIDPSRPPAYVDLSLALLHASRTREAEEVARRCLKSAPGFVPALSVLGAALFDRGEFQGAADAYAEALVADPADNFGLARGQLPIALAALGRNLEARRVLRGSLPLFPELLYREAWAFARDSCRDRTFHGQDWTSWRTRFQGTLRSDQDAYRAIARMLGSLEDPYTRLRDPEETGAVFLSRHGAAIRTDALGRVLGPSQSVVVGETPDGLGYIRLSNFTDPEVVARVREALVSLRLKEGIVLDLRGNGGGLSRRADEIGDLLVGPGKEAGVDESSTGPVAQITGGDGAVTGSPLTVLVDGQTGSAAERLARTLSNTGRAALVGDTTFGKGRAQVSRVLPGGTTVLVSVSEMLGPDGQPLQGRGLRPKQRDPRDKLRGP